MTRVRVGTRGSALALWQARHVAAALRVAAPQVDVELVEIVSTGDEQTEVPLNEVEGTGFFTASLERALSAREVDVAVHSYKDLPVEAADGLRLAAVPARGPAEDALCARDGLTLWTLPAGAKVGTCSARRTAQVRAHRRDLDLQPLRGNVPTRLNRVALGDLDAIVLARAGLARLGLEARITEVFSPAAMLPAPAQGALAVQCREEDTELADLLAALDDPATREAVAAERTLLHAIGGGCSVPVGALATWHGRVLTLAAGIFALDGTDGVRLEVSGPDPIEIGELAARQLLDIGGAAILAEFATSAGLDPTACEPLDSTVSRENAT